MSVPGYVAYKPPATTDLTVLRRDLERVRDEYGRRSSQALEAFQHLHRTANELGRPLSGLRRHSPIESERFFAHTIPGPDGHVYWNGPTVFRRNGDKVSSSPRRWWWEHIHGTIGTSAMRVRTICGDLACINPEHCECRHFREGVQFSDREMLGALQVMALRLGHTPSGAEWYRHGGKPSMSLFGLRFGSWLAALNEAGLSYRPNKHTPAACIKTILYVRKRLNRWPSTDDVPRFGPDLRALGLPSSDITIRRHLGSWPEALRRAGKRDEAA